VKPSDRYFKLVEWSEEDQCYIGTSPGLMFGGVHGTNEHQVYKLLCDAVEDWIRIQREDGEPLPAATAGKDYSGKFVVRVGEELHKALSIEALREGKSLNAYCVRKLRNGFGKTSIRSRRKSTSSGDRKGSGGGKRKSRL